MDTRTARGILSLIRAERDSRLQLLATEDPDYAYHQWQGSDEPFINELCLMLLVAIRHQVERELVWIAARVTSDQRELDGDEHSKRIRGWRDCLLRRKSKAWKRLEAKLSLKELDAWESSMKTLQLLANSYKHSSWATPDQDLVDHLQNLLNGRPPNLHKVKNFASLGESGVIKLALAGSLGLSDSVDFCDIAEELIRRADHFLSLVEANVTLSPVRGRVASIDPEELLQ